MVQPLILNVTNGAFCVGSIRIGGVAASSSILLGDTDSIRLYSFFDTPPESVIVSPTVPLPPPMEGDLE
ncbi:MAG: spore gernimation protein GerPD [Candidatus Cohnella colombiensis]|uniref:Spore gernimation protein GerPD n=1 Tax=Candidatus Cohnella colombiensis TaxID=3121368 RepID=A0AA95F0R0_9BACL|nr:MAG: spore gernimation protein GerPD [Cohnella sp.]